MTPVFRSARPLAYLHLLRNRGNYVSPPRLARLEPRRPEGAYYVLCDITSFGFDDDTKFARWLVSEVGVAGVPGSSFYSKPALGKHLIRFTFCKTHDVLKGAAVRLMRTRELAAKAMNSARGLHSALAQRGGP